MYLSHYGLNQSPFGITPNPAFFYAGNKRGAILEALIYAVTHGEGIIKVTGEVGSGKTMLCRMLENMLPENVVIIYLVNPTLSREEVVYAIAGELGLATGGKRPDEVIRILQHELITKHVAGQQVVLLIEEAQAMPLDTLEEIRLFSNLETAHHKLLQIVLFGQPELDENLNLPRMRQLKERITHSFKVPPMELEVIPEFLMFRMRTAGYHGPDIFTKKAIKLISTVSEGIVRRISILADKSLLAAFADNSHSIEGKHVKAAIEDSEFSYTATTRRRRKMMLAGALSIAITASAIVIWQTFWPQVKIAAPATPAARSLSIQPVAPIAASAPASAASASTTVPATAPASESATAVVAATPDLPKNETRTKANPPGTPAAPAATATKDILLQKLNDSKSWLQNEDMKHYSLQLALMDAEDHQQIAQYVQKIETDIGNLPVHLYPSRIGGMARFGILYGSFETHDEATKTRAKITAQLGNRLLQIRTIQGIRGEISKSHSDDLWP
ncbi:MAG TPA: AAA family ATPase [Burkholderiaceae bacterium]|jgi:type II secretory pathway predicted ATPase ExeA/septal ring-binding cell division protein DamX